MSKKQKIAISRGYRINNGNGNDARRACRRCQQNRLRCIFPKGKGKSCGNCTSAQFACQDGVRAAPMTFSPESRTRIVASPRGYAGDLVGRENESVYLVWNEENNKVVQDNQGRVDGQNLDDSSAAVSIQDRDPQSESEMDLDSLDQKPDSNSEDFEFYEAAAEQTSSGYSPAVFDKSHSIEESSDLVQSEDESSDTEVESQSDKTQTQRDRKRVIEPLETEHQRFDGGGRTIEATWEDFVCRGDTINLSRIGHSRQENACHAPQEKLNDFFATTKQSVVALQAC